MRLVIVPVSQRSGYTLLEVLIASVIALILLGGLYSALDLTLVRMDANRDLITSNDLSRAIFNRVTADISNTLGPLPPRSGGMATFGSSSSSSDSSGSTTSSSTTGSSSTDTSSSSGTTGGDTGAASTTSSSSGSGTTATGDGASAAAAGLDLPLGCGIIGTDKQLKIFLSRVPTLIVDYENATADGSQSADLRSVTYYLASDGSGLCRQERYNVTQDGIWNSSEPDRTDETADLIAPEVRDCTFEYYDGGTWQSSWDGSATDLDGASVVGPPRAIKIILVLEFAGKNGPVQKRVSQVIPIRAANGNYIPPLPETDSTTTTPTEGSTTTGGN